MKKILTVMLLMLTLTSCTNENEVLEQPVITDLEEQVLLDKDTLNSEEIEKLKNKIGDNVIQIDDGKIQIDLDDVEISIEDAESMGIK